MFNYHLVVPKYLVAVMMHVYESGTLILVLCLNVLEGHTDLVRSMHIFSNKMITGSYDQTIRVWDVYFGETIREFKGWHGSWIFSAKADSRRIISTSLGIKPVILDFGHDLNQEYLDFIKA